jgi:hypothetical protein
MSDKHKIRELEEKLNKAHDKFDALLILTKKLETATIQAVTVLREMAEFNHVTAATLVAVQRRYALPQKMIIPVGEVKIQAFKALKEVTKDGEVNHQILDDAIAKYEDAIAKENAVVAAQIKKEAEEKANFSKASKEISKALDKAEEEEMKKKQYQLPVEEVGTSPEDQKPEYPKVVDLSAEKERKLGEAKRILKNAKK